MKPDWLNDGRKIPDDVMYYIRVMAVHAVRMLGLSPEIIAQAYHFNRACIYRWLRHYDEGGFSALHSDMPPGACPLVTDEMEVWLHQTIQTQEPLDFGYDTPLWTCSILVELLKKKFDVDVGESTVRWHLKRLGFTSQVPEYQDVERNEQEIEHFLNVKFPKIQKLAEKMGADIGFQDEAGVGIQTRAGRTWGLRGQTPVIRASMRRGGYHVLSVVTAQGILRYTIKDESVNGAVLIDFLKQLIHHQKRPLILLVDHAPFHSSQAVRHFVRAHRDQLRIFFLPRRVPEMNPDEQVWNDIKTHRLGKQPIKDKKDLKQRLHAALKSLQKNTQRIISFFQLTDTKYAAETAVYES